MTVSQELYSINTNRLRQPANVESADESAKPLRLLSRAATKVLTEAGFGFLSCISLWPCVSGISLPFQQLPLLVSLCSLRLSRVCRQETQGCSSASGNEQCSGNMGWLCPTSIASAAYASPSSVPVLQLRLTEGEACLVNSWWDEPWITGATLLWGYQMRPAPS